MKSVKEDEKESIFEKERSEEKDFNFFDEEYGRQGKIVKMEKSEMII